MKVALEAAAVLDSTLAFAILLFRSSRSLTVCHTDQTRNKSMELSKILPRTASAKGKLLAVESSAVRTSTSESVILVLEGLPLRYNFTRPLVLK